LKTERYAAVDYLKALAIVAVVVTHAGFWDRDPRFTFADRILRGSWVPFQVPVFYVVSGFLYYRATAIGWRTVSQRLHRILLPYGIASLAVFALGISRPGTPIVRALLTGSALEIAVLPISPCAWRGPCT
jgi:fucose 4-O-acetylase-like acetyltransferase